MRRARATATLPSASSAGSGTTSTGARDRGRPDVAGIESLTERELQISRLVVDRKTNREIAAELYLSQKTIETHLRNIFRKLDADSRVDVARTIEQADRLAQSEA